MNSKLGLLLRIQLKDFFFASQAEKEQQAQRLGRRKSGLGYGVALTIGALAMTFAVVSIFLGMAFGLYEMGGSLDILIALATAAASLFTMFTTIYKTNGLLFGFRDYEMVMALPFPTSVIVACRVLILYAYNLLFALLILVPAGVIYAVFVQNTGAWYWTTFIIGALLCPVLPCIIGTAVGSLITVATSRFERRGMMGTIFTLVFMVLWMLFCFNMGNIVESIAAIGPSIVRTLGSIYPPAIWMTEGCCSGDAVQFLLYVLVSAGAFAAFVLVVGKYFRAINSALASRRMHRNFKLGRLTAEAPLKALVKKEWKMLTGNSQYFLNTCMGYIVSLIMAALFGFSGGNFSQAFDEIPASELQGMGDLHFLIPVALAAFLGLFLMMGEMTAVNISVEGRSFWILKTLPLSASQILASKRRLCLYMALGTAVILGVLLNITFSPTPLARVLCLIIPVAYALLSVVYGQWLNLRYPTFDWTSLVKVVKQSKPVMIMTLTGIPLALGPAALILFLGETGAVITAASVAALAVLFYVSIRRKGPAQFRALSA